MSWLPPSLDNTTTCQHAIASMPCSDRCCTNVGSSFRPWQSTARAIDPSVSDPLHGKNHFRMSPVCIRPTIYRMHHGRRSGCINLRRHAAAASAHELGARGCTNTAIYRCALRKRLRLRRRHYHIHQHHRHPYIITMQQHLRAHHRHR